jgi:hypothetical protein
MAIPRLDSGPQECFRSLKGQDSSRSLRTHGNRRRIRQESVSGRSGPDFGGSKAFRCRTSRACAARRPPPVRCGSSPSDGSPNQVAWRVYVNCR